MDELLTLQDIKEKFHKIMKIKVICDYIDGGALYQETLYENSNAFKRYKIRPHVMKDVSKRHVETTILGHRVAMPIGISPTVAHAICHPDAELATAAAACSFPVVFTVGHLAGTSISRILEKFPSAITFQQIFIAKNKRYTINFIRNAERAGAKGLVVTVDQPTHGIKHHDIRNRTRMAEYFKFPDEEMDWYHRKDIEYFLDTFLNATQTWEDITWMKSQTKLPIIVKGIMRADDALTAVNLGVAAIWVSNHGGRQLDSTQASIDVLLEIVKVVDGRCEVYIDSGFRSGLDVFKALALGAKAVFIGRPILHGLACGGSEGVKKVFDILRNELDNTMALSGISNVNDVTNDYVVKPCTCKL